MRPSSGEKSVRWSAMDDGEDVEDEEEEDDDDDEANLVEVDLGEEENEDEYCEGLESLPLREAISSRAL